MESHPTLTCISPRELTILRQQANALLTRLMADHDSSEARLAAMGKRDPIRTVTGLTAMERAIASTREMLADLEARLSRFNADLFVEDSHGDAIQDTLQHQLDYEHPVVEYPCGNTAFVGQHRIAATA